jgi:capsular polysaccharide biosynthesis protein
MGNQSIRLNRPETLEFRANIDSIDSYVEVLQKKIYTPTKESLENFMSLNSLDATNNIVNLSTKLDSRLLDIENDYVTKHEAKEIAIDNIIVFGE